MPKKNPVFCVKNKSGAKKCHFFPFLGSAPTYHFVYIKKEKKRILNGGMCCYKGTTAVSALDGSVIT